MRFVSIALMLVSAIGVSACAPNKILVKECQQAQDSEFYVCSRL